VRKKNTGLEVSAGSRKVADSHETEQRCSTQSLSGEVDRIRFVYQGYERTPRELGKRDPTNPGNRAIHRERQDGIYKLLTQFERLPLGGSKILDIGCGNGGVLASLMDIGAEPENLYGIDLLPDRIESARRQYPEIKFLCGNAECLDYPSEHFDLLLLFTVFSSILDDNMIQNITLEIARVLKPGGAILWYDLRYNNPWNPHVKGIPKHHLHGLFHDFEIHLQPITLIPPLARRLGSFTPVIYPLLTAIPLLRSHYLGLLAKHKGHSDRT